MRGDGNDRDGRESGSTDGAREAETRRDVEDGHNPGTARGGGRSSADASTTVDEGERERGSVKRFPPRNSESEEAGAGTTETSGGGGREPRGTGTSRRAAQRADDDYAGAQNTTRGGESGEIFAGGCGGARGGVERGRGGGAGAVRERVREQRGAETSRRRARSRERGPVRVASVRRHVFRHRVGVVRADDARGRDRIRDGEASERTVALGGRRRRGAEATTRPC